ncbi:hypothetical protein CLV97_1089 [Planifilum fimeticola]|jgi:hypothetical protein|uniref:Uncharacterized protein n=1 Tax=Planifilum fimeticola TaxID=201975 RepID=A0A2T0LG31_9BACL|nr:hypothetical protein CLV97_1089 [Planifilum fimeticola]
MREATVTFIMPRGKYRFKVKEGTPLFWKRLRQGF